MRDFRRYLAPTTKQGFFKAIQEIQSVRLESKSRAELEHVAVKLSELCGIPVHICFNRLKPRSDTEVGYLNALYEKIKDLSVTQLNDPTVFMPTLLNYHLTPYEVPLVKAVIVEKKKRVTNRWSRQSGKTKTSCACIFQLCATTPKFRFMVTGAGKRVSDVVMNKLAEFLYEINPLFMRCVLAKPLKTKWDWRNGSTIIATPNALHALRGDTLHGALIEEHEFIKEAETVRVSVIEPMLATTDGLIICNSTPWDTKSDFAKMWCNEKCQKQADGTIKHREGGICAYWTQFYNPWTVARDAGVIKENFVNQTIIPLKESDFGRYQREFMAQWSEDVNTYFTTELITGCLDNDLDYFDFDAPYWAGEFLIGVDLGQKVDYSAVVVLRKSEKVGADDKRPIWELAYRKLFPLETPFAVVIGFITALKQKMQACLGVYVDITNNPYVAEELEKSVGKGLTWGVRFTRTGDNFPLSLGKEAMFVYLKQQMRDGYLKMIYDDELIVQINAEKYELSKDGHFVFSHPDGTHDDLLFALGLAMYATLEKKDKAGGLSARGQVDATPLFRPL